MSIDFGDLWKRQNNPARTKSVRLFKTELKLDNNYTQAEEKKKSYVISR